jgi:hypothetical protein
VDFDDYFFNCLYLLADDIELVSSTNLFRWKLKAFLLVKDDTCFVGEVEDCFFD